MEKILPCDCHKVDTDGNVWSKLKQFSVKGKMGIQTIKTSKWRKLKGTMGNNGYLQHSIHGRIIRTNRLIAITFITNDFAYPEVHHINGIKTDNRKDNLKWGTAKGNAEDRARHGNSIRGTKSPHAKLNENKVKQIFKLRKEGWTLIKIAKHFDVSKKLILLVLQRKIWKHVQIKGEKHEE